MVFLKSIKGLMYGNLLLQNKIYKAFFSRRSTKKSSYWTSYKTEMPEFSKYKKKNPTILAISAYFHDSSACIIKNGKIVAAVDEERFTRIKHDTGFPTRSIMYCLKKADVRDVDLVVYFENPIEKMHRIKSSYIRNLPSYKLYQDTLESWAEKKLPHKIIEMVREAGLNAPVVFLNHHLCHAASSYLLSNFNEAAILTIASPPRIKPISAEANAISLREIPPVFIMAPAKINNGMARRGNFVAPSNITSATFGSAPVPCVKTMAMTATTANETAMGTLIKIRANNPINIKKIVIGFLPPDQT